MGDGPAPQTLLAYLAQAWPALAAQGATLAVPAVVEAGNFQLATRYLNNPMKALASLNQVALTHPLSAPGRKALRLLAELMNFAKDLQLPTATLTGLGQAQEAHATRHAALAGLATDEMRALVQREFASPGFLLKLCVRHGRKPDHPG